MDTQLTFKLTPEMCESIDVWTAKFPADQKRSAIIAALTIVQKEHAWLTDAMMNAVAEYLNVSYSAVYEVATFYSMFNLKQTGRYRIDVCTNVSCMLCGCDAIVTHLKKRLNIGFNETTANGMFTLKEVECLAACGGAPAMQIDGHYHENLTPEKVDVILEQLEKRA